MRVVVVGETGNIGTSLVRLLEDDERVESVVSVARRGATLPYAKVDWRQANWDWDFATERAQSRASCAPVRATVGRSTAVLSGRQPTSRACAKWLSCSNNGLNRVMPPGRIERPHAV